MPAAEWATFVPKASRNTLAPTAVMRSVVDGIARPSYPAQSISQCVSESMRGHCSKCSKCLLPSLSHILLCLSQNRSVFQSVCGARQCGRTQVFLGSRKSPGWCGSKTHTTVKANILDSGKLLCQVQIISPFCCFVV